MSDEQFEVWKRNIYPSFWLKKSKEYGVDSYCKGLIRLVEEMSPKNCFELGIGTGFPFAENFVAMDISVSGCDVAFPLLEEVKKNYPNVKVC